MLRRLAPYLAYAYLSAVGATTHLTTAGYEHWARLRRRGRFIYAFWHQRQALFTCTHRGQNAAALVSLSRDGELIARVLELSRMGAVRGSSSRGGAAAVRSLLEASAAGWDVGITPDGPKGPARKVKPGVLHVAQKLGIPILPMANALSRKLELQRSWDRFQVPLPFGRAVVAYGEPLSVAPGDDLDAKALELAAALERVTAEAEALLAARC